MPPRKCCPLQMAWSLPDRKTWEQRNPLKNWVLLILFCSSCNYHLTAEKHTEHIRGTLGFRAGHLILLPLRTFQSVARLDLFDPWNSHPLSRCSAAEDTLRVPGTQGGTEGAASNSNRTLFSEGLSQADELPVTPKAIDNSYGQHSWHSLLAEKWGLKKLRGKKNRNQKNV